MITIERLHADYRIAGHPDVRAHLARRLDRIIAERVAEALDAVAGDYGGEDGPVWRLRRLDLRLWLNTARLDDGMIARSFAATLARAIARNIADAGPGEVRRYPTRAAYLAAWVRDVIRGRAGGRWEYAEFDHLDDIRPGAAVAHMLSGEAHLILPVLQALDANEVERAVAAFSAADVAILWRALTGEEAMAPPRLRMAGVDRLLTPGRNRPAAESGPNGRARTALRWLLQLATGSGAPPPPAAAGLALQMSYMKALVAARPGLAAVLAGEDPDLATHLAAAADAGEPARAWLRAAWQDRPSRPALKALAAALDPALVAAEPAAAALRHSPFAGAALLIPSMRSLGLGGALDGAARHRVLAEALGDPQRHLAYGDAGLRWLAGRGDLEPVLAAEAAFDPETLAGVLAGFAKGLRGMAGSSPGYLARQFFRRPGKILRDTDRITVRLEGVGLGILLRMGGRLGDQGPVPWAGDRQLMVELVDG